MDIKNKLKDRKLKEQEKKVDDILAAAKRIFSQKGF
jgi:AcrR family transcriptional regulator